MELKTMKLQNEYKVKMKNFVLFLTIYLFILGFHGDSVVKNPSANVGDVGSIHGSGRFPGLGNGSLLQCSCWETHGRGA